ncbi:MAG: hypothetical protein EXQ97_07615 [Alphaproteobacteria bacterium]|nr:hypothetical protein [Alphaproteobacteria bacterium]
MTNPAGSPRACRPFPAIAEFRRPLLKARGKAALPGIASAGLRRRPASARRRWRRASCLWRTAACRPPRCSGRPRHGRPPACRHGWRRPVRD